MSSDDDDDDDDVGEEAEDGEVAREKGDGKTKERLFLRWRRKQTEADLLRLKRSFHS